MVKCLKEVCNDALYHSLLRKSLYDNKGHQDGWEPHDFFLSFDSRCLESCDWNNSSFLIGTFEAPPEEVMKGGKKSL